MKRRNKEKKLFLGIIVAILSLGIGYATITAVPLIINGSAVAVASANQADFKVHFNDLVSTGNYITYTETAASDSLTQTFVDDKHVTAASSNTDKAASIAVANDQQSATDTVSNMTAINDTVTLVIPIINESEGIKADLTTNIVNNNEEYFDVDADLATATLNGDDATTTVTVTVKVVKVPKLNDVEGTFTITLTAEPTE